MQLDPSVSIYFFNKLNSTKFLYPNRKQQRASDRMAALTDVSKLGNLGALAAWALEEGDEEDQEEVEEEELYQTETEIEKQNAIDIR